MRDYSARHQAVLYARSLHEYAPVFLDTETTGTGPTAEIIEIAIVGYDGRPLFDSLVKPRGSSEPEALRVHGITEDMLVDAPTWDKVWIQVEPILTSNWVGVYNLDFDLRLMKQTLQRYMLKWRAPEERLFCVMKLYAQFAGDWDYRRSSYRWHSLEEAGRQCGIALQNVHRALGDALLTRALFEYMVNWTG